MNFSYLTKENLDNFKRLFPDDQMLQDLTFDALLAASHGKAPDGSLAQQASPGELSKRFPRDLPTLTNCQYAVGGVVVDCLLMIWGAVGLHSKITPAAIAEVVEVIEPELPLIEEIAAVFADPNSSSVDKAKAIYRIGKLIYSGGMLEAIYKAITKSLTWWDMILYGVIGLAELTAAFLTDGAALILEFVAEIAIIGFIVSDGIKAYQECSTSQKPTRSSVNSNELVYLESYDPLMKKFLLSRYLTHSGWEEDAPLWVNSQYNQFRIDSGNNQFVKNKDNFKLRCVPPVDTIVVGGITKVMDTLNNPELPFCYIVDEKEVTTLLTITLPNALSYETNKFIQDGDRVNIVSSKNPHSYLGFFAVPGPAFSEVKFSPRAFEWVIRKVSSGS